MANHAVVKTRKKMTPEAVSSVFRGLNSSHFHNMLLFEYSDNGDDPDAWGQHTWLIKWSEDVAAASQYVHGGEVLRICWLNNPHSFEIRHGGGTDLQWWIDHVVTNEIALQFNGTIKDGGVPSEKWRGEKGKYAFFIDYLNEIWGDSPQIVREHMLEFAKKYVPPVFLEPPQE